MAYRWLIGGALFAGLILRIAIGLTDGAPTTDETAYLRSGISLAEGDGFQRDGHAELHFPPFAPFLFGMTSKLAEDPHTGVVVVTCLSGTVLILPLAGLGRRVAAPAGGAATAWIAALAPGLATMPAGRGAGSEALYALLVVSAIWFAVTARDRVGRQFWLWWAGSGLLVGLAYLTRPEGLFVAVPLGILLLRATRSSLAGGVAFAVPLLVCVVPYVAFLHAHTGRWELTAKTQDASIEAWHAVARSDRGDRDRVLYALDDSGTQFAAGRASLPALARDDPRGYLGIVVTNLQALARNIGGWWLLPLPVWALAAFGGWRRYGDGRVRLLLVVGALPVATALAFFVQPRYLVVTVAAATVLAGAAVATLSPRRRVWVMAGTVVALVVSSGAAFYGAGGWWHPGDHTDQRQAGEWLAAHTEPGERIMTRSMIVEFYAERPAIAIPYADLEEILRFARHYGAEYLVVDWFTADKLRPQLAELYDGAEVPGLREVHAAHPEGRYTRVFALDPPPPPTDAVGPSLGFMGDGAA